RLEQAQRRLAEIDDQWLLSPVRSRLDHVSRELDDAVPSVELALIGVRQAPALLGADGPTSYLVLFTTPVEARATTGFPGNYAEITFDDGRFDMVAFGRVNDLSRVLMDAGGGELSGPDDYLDRYARFDPHEDWRNITV